MKRLAHILGLWLWIGFSGGAVVLLLVATPVESVLKEWGMSRGRMDIFLGGVALAWVAGSFFASYFLEQNLRTTAVRATAHVLGAAISIGVFFLFLQAGAGIFGRFRHNVEDLSDRFSFGPYPDAEACVKIKDEGFTGVISLLNSAVPFEAVLLSRERDSAKAAGLELVEIPMLPWISENKASLDRLRELARSNEGKYYVHCYLGRHRADLAKFTIQEALNIAQGAPPAIRLPDKFERGPVERMSDSLVIGPLPTGEEWFEFLVRSGTRHVVALYDPHNPEDAPWTAQEKKTTEDLGLELHLVGYRSDRDADSAAALVRNLPGQVYLHSYLLDARTRRVAELVKER